MKIDVLRPEHGFAGAMIQEQMAWEGKTPSYWSWRLLYEIPYKVAGMEQWEQLYFLRCVRKTICALQAPVSERWPSAKRALGPRQGYAPPYLLIARRSFLSPNLVVFYALFDQTRLNLARTALAVERYRLDHGRLPGTLDELAPEYLASPPLDLFDGNTLRYKRREKGYVIYSVSWDGEDNGGAQMRSPMSPGADYPFRVDR